MRLQSGCEKHTSHDIQCTKWRTVVVLALCYHHHLLYRKVLSKHFPELQFQKQLEQTLTTYEKRARKFLFCVLYKKYFLKQTYLWILRSGSLWHFNKMKTLHRKFAADEFSIWRRTFVVLDTEQSVAYCYLFSVKTEVNCFWIIIAAGFGCHHGYRV